MAEPVTLRIKMGPGRVRTLTGTPRSFRVEGEKKDRWELVDVTEETPEIPATAANEYIAAATRHYEAIGYDPSDVLETS